MVEIMAKPKALLSDRHHRENRCDSCDNPAPYFVSNGQETKHACLECLDYVHLFYFGSEKGLISCGFQYLNPGTCTAQVNGLGIENSNRIEIKEDTNS